MLLVEIKVIYVRALLNIVTWKLTGYISSALFQKWTCARMMFACFRNLICKIKSLRDNLSAGLHVWILKLIKITLYLLVWIVVYYYNVVRVKHVKVTGSVLSTRSCHKTSFVRKAFKSWYTHTYTSHAKNNWTRKWCIHVLY